MTYLSLLVIKTNQLQEQFEFYSTLGIEFQYHRHGKGPFHYASTNGNPTIEIYPLPKEVLQPDTTTRLGFSVENLDFIIQLLTTRGTIIVSAPAVTEWGYSAIVQDADGRKIELTQMT